MSQVLAYDAPPLLRALSRLAGGDAAAALYDALPAGAVRPAARSCIEAGGDLMVTLRAPGDATISVAATTPGAPAPGIQRWRRWRLGASGEAPGGAGESLMFLDPQPGDLGHAFDFLPRPGLPRLFEQHLAVLRPRGRVYLATRAEPETGESWLSVVLDPRLSARETLAALRVQGAWSAATAALETLFGRLVTERTRPWSIALPCSAEALERGVVRLGTGGWARLPEDADKTRRVADAVGAAGGDGACAALAYATVAGRQAGPHTGPASARRAVGTAAEIDVSEAGITGLLLSLRAPVNNIRSGDA